MRNVMSVRVLKRGVGDGSGARGIVFSVTTITRMAGNREYRKRGRWNESRSASQPMLREEGGQDFSSFAGEGLVEDVAIGRGLGADVVRFGVARGVSGKTGSGLDGAGSADGEEDGATVECGVDVVEIVRHFTEPADMWANLRAAFAAWNGVG